MRVFNNVSDLIGGTPLLKLNNLKAKYNLESNLIAKLEMFNPGGSVKDRVAMNIINDAIKTGRLTLDSTIIEPTSGNTGIGIASVAASMGLKAIIVMPDTMSIERQKLIKAYGADLVLTDGKLGMKGAIKRAEELKEEISNSIIAGQFVNEANPRIHYETTGPEIWNDLDGLVDIFVAGAGSGGTISGVGKYLKEQNSNIRIVVVEPSASSVLSTGKSGAHKIQGIGAGFIPDNLDTDIYDEIITVSNEDAFDMTREIARTEGVLVGISSGAATFAAISLAKKPENKDKNIVVLLPDTGERYLSTPVFE